MLKKHRLPSGQLRRSALQRAAAKAVFGKQWYKAEEAFERVMKSCDPTWLVARPLWQPSPERSMLVGTGAETAAIRTVDGMVPAGDFAVRGRMELGPRPEGSHATVRIVFKLGGRNKVAVAIDDTEAWIRVWDDDKERWIDQESLDLSLVAGQTFEFGIEVTDSELRLFVNGRRLLVWEHGGRVVRDEVGIVVNDRIVWFEDLRLEPLAK